jgi:hypothetical protein
MSPRGSVSHDLAAKPLIATVARLLGTREAHLPTPPAIDECSFESNCASPPLVRPSIRPVYYIFFTPYKYARLARNGRGTVPSLGISILRRTV